MIKNSHLKGLIAIINMHFNVLLSILKKQIAYLQPIITQYFASNKSEIWS